MTGLVGGGLASRVGWAAKLCCCGAWSSYLGAGRWAPATPRRPTPAPQTAGAIFGGDIDLLSVKAVMRKLSRGVVRRGRASSTKASVMGAAAGLKAKGKKGGALSDACLRAMEALRQDWIARELARNA